VLAAQALQALARDLTAAIGGMGLGGVNFGMPELVEKPVREAERIFQGYAKAKPSKEDSYAAARAFLRGQKLDAWQHDLVASAIAEPIREASGATVLGSKKFDALLAGYKAEAEQGDLWRLTWHGLLYSYFSYDLSAARDEATHSGWEKLRAFLEQTWRYIDKEAGTKFVPDWVHVLRKEVDILSSKPVDKYARAYLRGDTTAVDQLAADLGISPSSWFWQALVLGAVKRATAEPDVEFRRLVPQLLQLIKTKPGFRDEAVEAILVRYHACRGAPQDERLRDFVCQPSVWKNPKFKAAGYATAWNRVPEPVWQMVLGWVNERNLKDFFDILAARNQADEGRLAFWSQYLKQITWTRLVFGSDTMALQRRSPEVRDLIAREEGAYAQLDGKPEVDAFMMQIGSYLIIEFSKKPNACYAYKVDELPFEPYAKHYDGGTTDLAYGYRGERAARIVHTPGWQARAADELRGLGIRPDRPDAQRVAVGGGATARTATGGGRATVAPVGPDMVALTALLRRFPRASAIDKRETVGGRLWVQDPLQRVQLGRELESMGFKWANSRSAWYYPGA